MTENVTQPKINELRRMCREKGLPTGGTKKELSQRLLTEATAGTDRFAGAGTLKCKVCSLTVKVTSTQKTTLEDGRTLITRQVKCTGKHGHTYSLPEIL